eukprot:12633638-Ditylum_brightwellii.AAC.1
MPTILTIPTATKSILRNSLPDSYVDTIAPVPVSREIFPEEGYSAKTIAFVLGINAVKLKYFGKVNKERKKDPLAKQVHFSF